MKTNVLCPFLSNDFHGHFVLEIFMPIFLNTFFKQHFFLCRFFKSSVLSFKKWSFYEKSIPLKQNNVLTILENKIINPIFLRNQKLFGLFWKRKSSVVKIISCFCLFLNKKLNYHLLQKETLYPNIKIVFKSPSLFLYMLCPLKT